MTHVYRQSGKTLLSLITAGLSFLFCVLFIILPVGVNFYWKIGILAVSILICILSLLSFFKRMQKIDAIFVKDKKITLMTRKNRFFESADQLNPPEKKKKRIWVRECLADDLAGFALCDGREILTGTYLTDQNVRKEITPLIHTMYLFGGFALVGLANISSKPIVMIPETSPKAKRYDLPKEDREAFMAMQRYLVLKLKNGHEWVLNAEGYTPMDLLAFISELETLTGLKALCPEKVTPIDYPGYEKKYWKLTLAYGIATLAFTLVTSLLLLLLPSPSNGVYYLEALLVLISCFAGVFFAMLLGVSFFDGKSVLPQRAKKYILWNGIMILLVLSLLAFIVKIL